MHSHDYRSAEPLAGKSVVLLGAGLSGLDIAMELSNVDAQVFHSVKLFSYLQYCMFDLNWNLLDNFYTDFCFYQICNLGNLKG